MDLSVVFAVLVGAILKKKLSSPVMRKAIPYFVFVSQFLGRLLMEVQPAEAGVLGGLFKSLGPSLLVIARDSLASTIMGVGIHSTWKNAGAQFVDHLKLNVTKTL